MKRFLLHLSMLALALTPFVAHAAGGAFEINQDCIAVGCFVGDAAGYPVTITQPGTYVLTSDLAPSGNQFIETIIVTAAPVDIDLNGHTIEGGATCSGTPVTAACTGFTGYTGIAMSHGGVLGNFHVHNGRIHGFRNAGILASDSASGSSFEQLVLSENAFGIGVSGAAGTDAGHIRDCQIVRNSTTGVTASAGSRSRTFVENSTISGNQFFGLYLGSGSVVTGSRINDNGQVGIDCTALACALGQNTFQGNAGGPSAQYAVGTLKDMGGNVCLDHVCP